MRLTVVLAVAALMPVTLGAQSATVKTEQKIEVKDGKDVTLTGCVESHPDPASGAAYALTNVADKVGERHSYLLVGETGELGNHVGHMVEIKGKAADDGEGKVKVKTKTKVEREDAPDTRSESTSEIKGGMPGWPLLGVKSVKMLRPTCS
jgi:hypothetical protein